ncbi:MAG: glutamate--tRNA ligase [Bacteroidales bacterium]|nr:glutamate--tRNA ligase [Bacteroidales bacterium]
MENKNVRLRFAPSPTGPLHIGGVRTALYNYLFAKKHNGKLILRIEDTDRTRFVPGAEEYIIESLNWCGIKFDEGVHLGGDYGPYKQSERKNIYKKYVDKLIADGNAYYAFDTPEELEQMRNDLKALKISTPQYNAISRMSMKNSLSLPEDIVKQKLKNGEPYVIRIKIPEDEEIKVFDLIRGWITVNSSQMDDKVLFKSDGLPTYHLANIVDDHLMKITHVIRGEEWLPSAPLHVLLYRYFGWEKEMPEFAHLSLLLKPNGHGKLSKRDGDKLGFPVFPLQWTNPKTNEISSGYREQGYFPEAFINMLALLGWNPGEDIQKEIFSMDELIEAFSLEHVGKSGSKFNPDKAKWFNQQYLKQKSNNELANLYLPILKEKGLNPELEYIAKVCGFLKERVTFVSEFWDQSHYFFRAPEEYNAKVIKKRWKENTPEILTAIVEIIKDIEDFKAEIIEKEVKAFIETNGLGMGQVMNAIRLTITGANIGPGMFEIAEMLGKDEFINRIKTGVKKIKK